MKTLEIPDWTKTLSGLTRRLPELLSSKEVQGLVAKANGEYLHWDKFRYQKMPEGLAADAAWAMLKLARLSSREFIPVLDKFQKPFSFALGKMHLRDLSYIDSHTSGMIATSDGLPNEKQRQQLVINGLMEEAISSSQIEGASTTRKVAKEMIELNRAPKSKDELMILNNYRAMTQLSAWKNRALDDDFLLELHQMLTRGTLEDPKDEGRFRSDQDDIVVQDRVTGDVVHLPPKMHVARKELNELYKFANASNDKEYVHPFVRASIVHFLLGYIHPFVDGNGRCARALFYWLMLREGYWMFQYLPISLQIKNNRVPYDKAFQYVETDESDLTYFLAYKFHATRQAIDGFISYLKRKQRKANELKARLIANESINERQIEIIRLFQSSPSFALDLQSYVSKFKVVYETARRDVMDLVRRGILRQTKSGKKYLFTRGDEFPSG